jgi:hypothetical protein
VQKNDLPFLVIPFAGIPVSMIRRLIDKLIVSEQLTGGQSQHARALTSDPSSEPAEEKIKAVKSSETDRATSR